MAEDENWIKEMGHVLTQADIGHDLTTIHLLLSKHKSLQTEIRAHEHRYVLVKTNCPKNGGRLHYV